MPLARGTSEDDYLQTLLHACVKCVKFDAQYLVVSLGVDTAASDPICDFNLTQRGFAEMGRAIANVGLPTLFVLEG